MSTASDALYSKNLFLLTLKGQIAVEFMDGHTLEGEFATQDELNIFITVDDEPIMIPRSQIRYVKGRQGQEIEEDDSQTSFQAVPGEPAQEMETGETPLPYIDIDDTDETVVLAEDEEASPWNPFHVDRGFDKKTSAVTTGTVMNATYQLMSSGATAQPHLTGITHYLTKAFGITSLLFGMSKTFSIFISPPNARAIASSGYSKQDVKEYIAENATLPVDEVNTEFAYTEERVIPWTVHGLAEQGKVPKKFDVPSGGRMPIVESPDVIDIFVCGSRDRNRDMVFRTSYARSATREVKLPANWESRLNALSPT